MANVTLSITESPVELTISQSTIPVTVSSPIVGREPHIVDADGTLADITTKFNTLLAQLETLGLIAAS